MASKTSVKGLQISLLFPHLSELKECHLASKNQNIGPPPPT